MLQQKLLRAIENKEIVRIGENDPRKVDTRIVAATNRSLPDMVRDGTFRQDLYFRLKVFVIEIPPRALSIDGEVGNREGYEVQVSRGSHIPIFVTPSGYRIEGITSAELIKVLRGLK